MKQILFYGDSNTYGYDPRGPFGGRYPAQVRWVERLREMLEGTWQICADGMNGRCIPLSRQEIRRVWREAETCGTAGTPADILAVMLGTNDCLQMREPSAGPVARKLAEMLAALTELRGGAGPRILVLAPPTVEFGGAIFGERPWIPEVRLTDAYRDAAEEAGALFVDTAAWDLPMSFDRVHLSEEGHRRMAEELAACLRKIGDSI